MGLNKDLMTYFGKIRNANLMRYSYFFYSRAVQLIKSFLPITYLEYYSFHQ